MPWCPRTGPDAARLSIPASCRWLGSSRVPVRRGTRSKGLTLHRRPEAAAGMHAGGAGAGFDPPGRPVEHHDPVMPAAAVPCPDGPESNKRFGVWSAERAVSSGRVACSGSRIAPWSPTTPWHEPPSGVASCFLPPSPLSGAGVLRGRGDVVLCCWTARETVRPGSLRGESGSMSC